jgi:hypothetical protein
MDRRERKKVHQKIKILKNLIKLKKMLQNKHKSR